MSDFIEIDPNSAEGRALESQMMAAVSGAGAVVPTPPPTIRNPGDGYVTLPAGLVLDGKTITEVEVRELTGADEERIVKARATGGLGKFISTLLKCGVASIGEVDEPGDLLDDLLIGDRDYLLVAIRKATYGEDIEFGQIVCPGCQEEFNLVGDVGNVPVTPLIGDREFEVRLRKGGSATVTFPNGADQRATLDDLDLTGSERNTLLLSRVVSYITDASGEMIDVAATPSAIRNLGIADRNAILKAISDKAPGPRYDGLVVKHECGEEIPAPVDLMSLFPGL